MKKSKKIIIIMLLIGIFLIGILLIAINFKENKIVDGMYTQKDIELRNEEVENYLSDKVTPKGLSRLYGQYEGDNELNDLYRKLYLFVNYLPELSKKVINKDEDKINKYFEKNKDDIKDNLGIGKEEKFLEFIKYLEKIGYNGEKFIDCQIVSKDFKNVNNYFIFDVKFNFEEFDNDFTLKVHFSNYKAKEPIVFYSIITDDINGVSENK